MPRKLAARSVNAPVPTGSWSSQRPPASRGSSRCRTRWPAGREQVVFQADSLGGTGWPWSWYLRDQPLGYYDMSNVEAVPRDAPALLVADGNHGAMAPLYEDYEKKRFRLRVWWVPDWGAASPADWLKWAVTREPWSPTATMDEWLYLRPDVAELAATEG